LRQPPLPYPRASNLFPLIGLETILSRTCIFLSPARLCLTTKALLAPRPEVTSRRSLPKFNPISLPSFSRGCHPRCSHCPVSSNSDFHLAASMRLLTRTTLGMTPFTLHTDSWPFLALPARRISRILHPPIGFT